MTVRREAPATTGCQYSATRLAFTAPRAWSVSRITHSGGIMLTANAPGVVVVGLVVGVHVAIVEVHVPRVGRIVAFVVADQ